MKAVRHIVLWWLPIAASSTVLCFFTYAAVQQNYRQSLNDPQIQMAEDAAHALAAGTAPESIVGTGEVDIATSLAPYITVYDEVGVPIASSGMLDGQMPVPPIGALQAARDGGGKDTPRPNENRITWQPREGVRSAVVIVHVQEGQGGFVMAGRNMREVEAREAALSKMTFMAWFALLASSLFFITIARLVR